MRKVLSEGNTQPRVALAAVADQPGSIAVGALAGLAGEITIADGEVWVARSRGGRAVVSGPALADRDHATLLTVAHVPQWTRITLADGASGAALAEAIAEAARSRGVDTSKPFPFIVEGQLTELEAHVIAGSCPIASPEGDSPWRFSLQEPMDGKLVGFYAEGMDGIMTHHGDATHAHVVFERDGKTVTGHADHAGVAPGATVRVPAGV
ncbi:MAG: hypothetical protein QGI75_04580 [Phycisphaerales bacterium]|nr:hypothetical protein [Phycisphaerales bacterium]